MILVDKRMLSVLSFVEKGKVTGSDLDERSGDSWGHQFLSPGWRQKPVRKTLARELMATSARDSMF
jgi:hypothetical protein